MLIDVVVEDSRPRSWFVPTAAPDRAPRVVAPREHGHEYAVEHHCERRARRPLPHRHERGRRARNFKLVAAPVRRSRPRELDRRSSRTATTSRSTRVNAFADHLVLSERADGLDRLRGACASRTSDVHEIVFPDPVYSVWVGPNPEFETATLRYGYTSLVAPVTDVDYDLDDARARRS